MTWDKLPQAGTIKKTVHGQKCSLKGRLEQLKNQFMSKNVPKRQNHGVLQNYITAATEGLNSWYPAANKAGIRAPKLRTFIMDRFLLVKTHTEQAQVRATLI